MIAAAANNEQSSDSGLEADRSGGGRMQVNEPMDLLQISLGAPILVKLRHGRQLTGKLVAYDEHLNLMLSDARETVKENSVTVAVKELQIVYVRGDLVIMVSPQQNQV